ncbi:plasmid partitioning protein RepB C-terminal domain-containing protein [Caballeronia sp. dw_276]|uniref:plasmid partitioning protein RepB C-terminal domain-containing protein n=1 Tax=Caballeronia sp. dw_276 TaxID=2719795 RepID=UPI001BD44FD3|nr:plasmid partitioning protein RepB C-terminal domain-containing protein [Caballeronia sp. dw_276]
MNAYQNPTGVGVKTAFACSAVTLKLKSLRIAKPLPQQALVSRKFFQVLASIAAVGLVEPVVVTAAGEPSNLYRVLDGRLRLEALRRLDMEEALCLITTDDEAYTYNKHVSHLSQAQDARMIAKALAHGVSREHLATVLGIGPGTVRQKQMLLTGICREAQALLADKTCPGATFTALKAMRPTRQIEAAELMCGQGNFASSFAKAILAATPPELLELHRPGKRKVTNDLSAQLARLEKELAILQAQVSVTEEGYGIDHLHLSVATSYIASLMREEAVSSWLSRVYPEYSVHFQSVVNEVEVTNGPRKAVKLPFLPSYASAAV